jgi:hypothetical protein
VPAVPYTRPGLTASSDALRSKSATSAVRCVLARARHLARPSRQCANTCGVQITRSGSETDCSHGSSRGGTHPRSGTSVRYSTVNAAVAVLAEALQHTRQAMEEAVLDTEVTGYEGVAAALELPAPDDRHVLAATVGRVNVIVTVNLKHFLARALSPFKIEARHPDVTSSRQRLLSHWQLSRKCGRA